MRLYRACVDSSASIDFRFQPRFAPRFMHVALSQRFEVGRCVNVAYTARDYFAGSIRA